MTPCVMYTRVSSEEQAKVGYSIPFQRARLEAHALDRGLEVVERFEDVHSAKQTGRPSFERLLRYVEAHPLVRTVLVHRVDRLIRNHYEYGLLVEQLGLRVLSVVEPAEDSAAGRLQHGVSVVMAKYHSDNLSQEVVKGLRAKFEAGGCVTKAPVGYKNVTRTRTEKAKVIVDGKTAPAVRQLFETYATGQHSLGSLAEEFSDLGLTTKDGHRFTDERVKRVLQHPFYAGLVRYRGDVHEGTHPPLVSRELFERVQSVIRGRSDVHGAKGSKFFLLRGLLWCGTCGTKLTAEDHPKGSYYRCLPGPDGRRGSCPYVRVRALDGQVVALLKLIELTPALKAEALVRLQAEDAARAKARVTDEPKLLERKRKLEDKLARLTDALADGTLPKEEYRARRLAIDDDLREVDERTAFLNEDFTALLGNHEVAIETAASLTAFYGSAATEEERKTHLRRVFQRIEVTNKEITGIEYNPPFDLLLTNPVKAGSRMS
ncbi:hypothetical protein EPO34_02745 [Patescibacteria group bacterium]|nr:MAG: hypothetical protein EPO34_02745 [Patescibacteria group bacterium]